mgnify:CR=1 FL=1
MNLQQSLGIMDSSGVRDELNLINKKQKALRDQLVLSNHLTNDGTPRVTTHHEPNQNSDLGTQREPKNNVPFVPRDEDLRPYLKEGPACGKMP